MFYITKRVSKRDKRVKAMKHEHHQSQTKVLTSDLSTQFYLNFSIFGAVTVMRPSPEY